jgi:vacuolar-type H+-ATPase subunit I/STV1
MNEEIKEILEELEDCKITKHLNYNLDNKDARVILNYITNLQEENQKLVKVIEEFEEWLGSADCIDWKMALNKLTELKGGSDD